MNRVCSKDTRSWRCSERAGRSHHPGLSVALAFLAALGSGCIVVPTPLHRPDRGTRLNVDKQTLRAVTPGEPLADLLLRLGEPDEVSIDGRQLAYRWERVWAYWFVGGYGAAAGGPLTRSRALVVDLDDQNRVRAAVVGADDFFARPETARVFAPEHGGKDTRAGANSSGEAQGPKEFRGEPLEFHGPAMLQLGVETDASTGKRRWRGADGQSPSFVSGEVFLTPTAIHFKREGSLGTDAPEWSLRFKDIPVPDYTPVAFGAWIVIRKPGRVPGTHEVYTFGVGTKSQAKSVHAQTVRLWETARRSAPSGPER